MLNSFLILFIFLFCSKGYAIEQNWPCGPFMLYEKSVLSKSIRELHNSYQGEYDDYIIETDAFWQLESVNGDADCGTSGCEGRIINTKNKQAGNVRFFCTMFDIGNFDKVQCVLNNSEEYFLRADGHNEYRAKLCGTYEKYADLNECDRCFCLVHDSRGAEYTGKMACTLQYDDTLHCMTGNIYFEKYRPNSENSDYENCVDLKVK